MKGRNKSPSSMCQEFLLNIYILKFLKEKVILSFILRKNKQAKLRPETM